MRLFLSEDTHGCSLLSSSSRFESAKKKSAGHTSRKTFSSTTMIFSGLWLLAFLVINVKAFHDGWGREYPWPAGGRDLYRQEMETFEKPPSGKMPSAADREKFFRELALERVKAEKVKGVYVLICKNPTYLYVDLTADAGLTAETGRKVREALISAFREKKYDDGLAKAVQVVLDAKGLKEKK